MSVLRRCSPKPTRKPKHATNGTNKKPYTFSYTVVTRMCIVTHTHTSVITIQVVLMDVVRLVDVPQSGLNGICMLHDTYVAVQLPTNDQTTSIYLHHCFYQPIIGVSYQVAIADYGFSSILHTQVTGYCKSHVWQLATYIPMLPYVHSYQLQYMTTSMCSYSKSNFP